MKKSLNKKKELASILMVLCLFNTQLFFSVTTIFGYKYGGIENSIIYAVYVLLIMFFSLFLCIYTFIKRKYRFNYKEIFILFLPTILTFEMGIRVLIYGEIRTSMHYLIYFYIWCVPAIFAAVYVKKTDTLKIMIKWFEVVEWILTIAVVFSFLIPFLLGTSYSIYRIETNINYQTAAYMSSFAYGLNLYFLFYGKEKKRFQYTFTKVYFVISLGLLLIQLLCVFISGGRGGAVLAIIYTLFFFFITISDKDSTRRFKGTVFVLSIFAITICILPIMLQNSNFYSAFSRSFSFIGDNGINWSGTSNRDFVYQLAIQRAFKHPLFGYGIFYALGKFGYPHNIFLEWLLEGGVVLLTIETMILLIVLKKGWMIALKCNGTIILVLLLYPLTELMFSGTYMETGIFWFVVCYIIIYKEVP